MDRNEVLQAQVVRKTCVELFIAALAAKPDFMEGGNKDSKAIAEEIVGGAERLKEYIYPD